MRSKTIVFISIGGLLFWGVWVYLTQPAPAPITTENRTREKQALTDRPSMRAASAVASVDSESFYRTIIDNNLFRPLGWTPPRPKEPYRLIGTLLPRDDTTPARAFLQSTTGNHKTYRVSPGDKVDDTTKVVSIARKSVVLETDGKQRTLRLHIRF